MESLPLDHQDLRTIIENAGLRCTPQRLAVYDHLSQSAEHPTAEDVFQAVRSQIPKISLATVYKALEALVAIGVATKLTAGRWDTGRGTTPAATCTITSVACDPEPFTTCRPASTPI